MRVENWHSKLVAYVDQQERVPFAYGTNDCLLMTSGAVAAITGVDHAAPYRGQYATLDQGLALIGMPTLEFVRSKLAEIHISEAHDGDVAALLVSGEWAFGVLIGAHFYVQTETGLGVLPRRKADKAFRVD